VSFDRVNHHDSTVACQSLDYRSTDAAGSTRDDIRQMAGHGRLLSVCPKHTHLPRLLGRVRFSITRGIHALLDWRKRRKGRTP
jgi:hypothetical protein